MSIIQKWKTHPEYLQRLFIVFSFFFFAVWALSQPFNAGPDEYMRYQIPEFIYKYGELPHGGDPRIRNEIWGTSYGFYPIFSYIIAAGFMKVTSFFTADAFALLMAARMVSVLFGTGTVYFLIKIANRIFPKEQKWLFICLAALLPEAVFITSYVNNDAMAIFSIAFIVYMWIRGMETHWDKRSCLWLAVAMSFCLMSYYDAYGYLLCSALLYTADLLLCQRKRDVAAWLKKGVFILLIVFVLTGWWFIRNAIIYEGDVLGLATNNAYANQYAQDAYKPALNQTPFRQGISVFSMIFSSWGVMVFKSFVGVFGYMNLFLSPVIYGIYLLIFAAGALGCLLHAKELFALRRNGAWQSMGCFHWVMLLGILISNLLNVYHSYMVDYQPQGRYSLPMLIPLMYFVTVGLGRLAEKLPFSKASQKYKKWILYLTALLVLVIAVYAYARIIYPVYVLDIPSGNVIQSPAPDIG